MTGRVGAVGAAFVLALLSAIPAFAQSPTVEVVDNEFEPASIEVDEGTTVTWNQTGDNPHSVTADDGTFDSHPNCPPDCMEQGDTYEYTFDEPGEYPYYCKIHGDRGGEGMAGVVVVQAAAEGDTDADEDTEADEDAEADDLPLSGGGAAAVAAAILLVAAAALPRRHG